MESKKKTHMNLFAKQKQTHRLRKQTYIYQVGKEDGRINSELEISRHTPIYKIDNQQRST